MSQYLQRLNIASVEEVGVDTNMPHYTQHVDVVEVVDSDGNPWEPVPGPDPWDDLVIADKPLWHVDNIYEEGNTLTATTGTFVGGNLDNTVYRWRFQTRHKAEDPWVNGTWTNYPNDLQQVSYSNVSGGQIRFQVQARDAITDPENVVQVNSFTNTKTVAYTPISVSTPVASGGPYVGQTITCTTPTVTGGDGVNQIDYFWVDETNAMIFEVPYMSQTTVVTSYDVGKLMKCLVTVTSGDGQNATVASNQLGPMQAAPVMTPAQALLNGTVIDQSQPEEVPPGTHNLQMVLNQTPPDVQFFWSLRSGTGTLTQDPILPDMATYTPGENDFSPMIACTAQSTISGDASVSFTLIII